MPRNPINPVHIRSECHIVRATSVPASRLLTTSDAEGVKLKKFALLSLFALLFIATFANAQFCNCLFYGGDLNVNSPDADGLANENDAAVRGNPYGAATYQNFILSSESTAPGLFTDNLSGLNPATGYWEIRTGVSEGNGGTLVASGTGAMTHTPTGRGAFGYKEYRDEVDGLNIILAAGTQYWFAVVPNDPNNANRSFNSNSTDQTNAIGYTQPNNQYFNRRRFGRELHEREQRRSFPGLLVWRSRYPGSRAVQLDAAGYGPGRRRQRCPPSPVAIGRRAWTRRQVRACRCSWPPISDSAGPPPTEAE